MPLFTFGHGTADRDRLLELLHVAGIRELVDVRTAPGSRRNPPPDSPDIGLRNRSFAGYAAHMRTRDFLDAVRDVLDGVRDKTTVFCSESVWWRCHRRMIADFAVLSAQW